MHHKQNRYLYCTVVKNVFAGKEPVHICLIELSTLVYTLLEIKNQFVNRKICLHDYATHVQL